MKEEVFNVKKLTGAEIIAAEKLAGGSLESTTGTYALFHVWRKRSNPEESWDDTLNVPLEELEQAAQANLES